MRTYTIWNEEKIKELLSFVEDYLHQGKSTLAAFRDYSKKININPYTIRNLYYKKVKEFGIEKKQNISFTKEETNMLLNKINVLLKQGHSVRSACLKLANNDKTLFLRYQNKYRSSQENIINNNIITIKQNNKVLTDEDINNLIKGFVALIKKTAVYDLNQKYKSIINDYNVRLNNTLIELNKKNNLLNSVLLENEILKGKRNQNLDNLLNKIKS